MNSTRVKPAAPRARRTRADSGSVILLPRTRKDGLASVARMRYRPVGGYSIRPFERIVYRLGALPVVIHMRTLTFAAMGFNTKLTKNIPQQSE